MCSCACTPEEVLVCVCVCVCVEGARGVCGNDAGTENFTTRESNAGVKCRAIENFDDSALHTVLR